MRATFIPSFFPEAPRLYSRGELQALEDGGGAGYGPTRTRACAAGFSHPRPGVPRGPATNQLSSPGARHGATLVPRTEPEPGKLPFNTGLAEVSILRRGVPRGPGRARHLSS
jgi:hypothetical protein